MEVEEQLEDVDDEDSTEWGEGEDVNDEGNQEASHSGSDEYYQPPEEAFEEDSGGSDLDVNPDGEYIPRK
ncbi:hypothetical protein BJ508DRAFT_336288 [Ascobolus immersus RN42]|uniref:Uncharacterized protein n=1 Tax=Ascobolus immersus RN42 TaxID=1160509 RepID=A0A3N4HDX3_ASCIM|nr:hypothetical protein BJ508DRAFT_336288 [Ascobolus immersus RN42]